MNCPVYTSKQAATFFIMIGIPGVGKTSFSKSMFEESPWGTLKAELVSRDEIRCNLIWEARKSQDISNQLLNLDKEVDRLEIASIEKHLEKRQEKIVILDGCHTQFFHLLNIIDTIKKLSPDSLVNLFFIGDENSKCYHKLSEHKEGEYSDYNLQSEGSSQHDTIPKEVLTRKRKELKELITYFTKALRFKADAVYFLSQSTIEFIEQGQNNRLTSN